MKRQGKVDLALIVTMSLLSSFALADVNSSANSTAANSNASAQITQLLQNNSNSDAQNSDAQNADAEDADAQAAEGPVAALAPDQAAEPTANYAGTTQAATNSQATDNSQATAQPAANSMNSQAFASTVHNMLPLTPDQIRTLRYLLNESQQAASEYPGTPPLPTSSTITANLAPGATPPIIRLGAGYVTSIVFDDATGAPWPISAYDLGDPKDFNVQWDKVGNTLMVQALDHYQGGNLAVMLKGLDTPIMVTLMPGQRAVDYRTDIRVPRLGPNANPVYAGLPDSASPNLLNVLDGVPPDGAQQLQVRGGEAEAWLIDNHIYMRTPLTVLSPAWIAATNSSDGTHAYELPNSPVILASQNGAMVRLTVGQN